MIRTQISLDAAMYQNARTEARRQGISLAELVRRALAFVLPPARPREQPWMRFSGVIDGGHSDDSRNESIDQIVYGRKP